MAVHRNKKKNAAGIDLPLMTFLLHGTKIKKRLRY